MHTELCDLFGIEYPIFAFSHCRDVVAAVSRAGGMGVLGALHFTPEELELELAWMDEHGVEPPTDQAGKALLGWTDVTARPQVEVALKHPIALLANALGPPPADVVELAHQHGVKVAG